MKTFFITTKKKFLNLKFFSIFGKNFSAKWFGHLVEEEVEIPKPKDNELLLKTMACGICGTDIDKLLNPNKIKSININSNKRLNKHYLGHEIVAKVIDSGSPENKSLIGKKVIIGDINVCKSFNIVPECDNCNKKRGIYCTNKHKRTFNKYSYGGFSEYFLRSKHQCLVIPSDLNANNAVFIEPLSTAINCYRNCKDKNKILINGLTTISVLLYRTLINYKFNKNNIFFRVFNKIQKDKAMDIGINLFYEIENNRPTHLNDFDTTIDFTGKSDEIKKFVNISKPNSEILLFGMDSDNLNIDFNQLIHKGINVQGIHGYSSENTKDGYQSDLETAKNLIYSKEILVEDLISEVEKLPYTKKFLQKISLSASGLFNKNIVHSDYKFRSILSNE